MRESTDAGDGRGSIAVLASSLLCPILRMVPDSRSMYRYHHRSIAIVFLLLIKIFLCLLCLSLLFLILQMESKCRLGN